MLSLPSLPLPPRGSSVDYSDYGYTVQNFINGGQFGKTYLVTDNADGSYWVAKSIELHCLDARDRTLSMQEADVMSRIRHENIVKFKESFVHENSYLVIIMEYCSRGDLTLALRRKREKNELFTETEIISMFKQLVGALAYVHSQKILHRDLKPSNILVADSGSLKVCDFGISRVMTTTMEQARTAVGTPQYMAPEMCENKPYTYASDMWSLGCVMYELCTLRSAFEGNNFVALFFKVVFEAIQPIPSHYSTQLNVVISNLLSKDPSQRKLPAQLLRHPLFVDRAVSADEDVSIEETSEGPMQAMVSEIEQTDQHPGSAALKVNYALPGEESLRSELFAVQLILRKIKDGLDRCRKDVFGVLQQTYGVENVRGTELTNLDQIPELSEESEEEEGDETSMRDYNAATGRIDVNRLRKELSRQMKRSTRAHNGFEQSLEETIVFLKAPVDVPWMERAVTFFHLGISREEIKYLFDFIKRATQGLRVGFEGPTVVQLDELVLLGTYPLLDSADRVDEGSIPERLNELKASARIAIDEKLEWAAQAVFIISEVTRARREEMTGQPFEGLEAIKLESGPMYRLSVSSVIAAFDPFADEAGLIGDLQFRTVMHSIYPQLSYKELNELFMLAEKDIRGRANYAQFVETLDAHLIVGLENNKNSIDYFGHDETKEETTIAEDPQGPSLPEDDSMERGPPSLKQTVEVPPSAHLTTVTSSVGEGATFADRRASIYPQPTSVSAGLSDSEEGENDADDPIRSETTRPRKNDGPMMVPFPIRGGPPSPAMETHLTIRTRGKSPRRGTSNERGLAASSSSGWTGLGVTHVPGTTSVLSPVSPTSRGTSAAHQSLNNSSHSQNKQYGVSLGSSSPVTSTDYTPCGSSTTCYVTTPSHDLISSESSPANFLLSASLGVGGGNTIATVSNAHQQRHEVDSCKHGLPASFTPVNDSEAESDPDGGNKPTNCGPNLTQRKSAGVKNSTNSDQQQQQRVIPNVVSTMPSARTKNDISVNCTSSKEEVMSNRGSVHLQSVASQDNIGLVWPAPSAEAREQNNYPQQQPSARFEKQQLTVQRRSQQPQISMRAGSTPPFMMQFQSAGPLGSSGPPISEGLIDRDVMFLNRPYSGYLSAEGILPHSEGLISETACLGRPTYSADQAGVMMTPRSMNLGMERQQPSMTNSKGEMNLNDHQRQIQGTVIEAREKRQSEESQIEECGDWFEGSDFVYAPDGGASSPNRYNRTSGTSPVRFNREVRHAKSVDFQQKSAAPSQYPKEPSPPMVAWSEGHRGFVVHNGAITADRQQHVEKSRRGVVVGHNEKKVQQPLFSYSSSGAVLGRLQPQHNYNAWSSGSRQQHQQQRWTGHRRGEQMTTKNDHPSNYDTTHIHGSADSNTKGGVGVLPSSSGGGGASSNSSSSVVERTASVDEGPISTRHRSPPLDSRKSLVSPLTGGGSLQLTAVAASSTSDIALTEHPYLHCSEYGVGREQDTDDCFYRSRSSPRVTGDERNFMAQKHRNAIEKANAHQGRRPGSSIEPQHIDSGAPAYLEGDHSICWNQKDYSEERGGVDEETSTSENTEASAEAKYSRSSIQRSSNGRYAQVPDLTYIRGASEGSMSPGPSEFAIPPHPPPNSPPSAAPAAAPNLGGPALPFNKIENVRLRKNHTVGHRPATSDLSMGRNVGEEWNFRETGDRGNPLMRSYQPAPQPYASLVLPAPQIPEESVTYGELWRTYTSQTRECHNGAFEYLKAICAERFALMEFFVARSGTRDWAWNNVNVKFTIAQKRSENLKAMINQLSLLREKFLYLMRRSWTSFQKSRSETSSGDGSGVLIVNENPQASLEALKALYNPMLAHQVNVMLSFLSDSGTRQQRISALSNMKITESREEKSCEQLDHLLDTYNDPVRVISKFYHELTLHACKKMRHRYPEDDPSNIQFPIVIAFPTMEEYLSQRLVRRLLVVREAVIQLWLQQRFVEAVRPSNPTAVCFRVIELRAIRYLMGESVTEAVPSLKHLELLEKDLLEASSAHSNFRQQQDETKASQWLRVCSACIAEVDSALTVKISPFAESADEKELQISPPRKVSRKSEGVRQLPPSGPPGTNFLKDGGRSFMTQGGGGDGGPRSSSTRGNMLAWTSSSSNYNVSCGRISVVDDDDWQLQHGRVVRDKMMPLNSDLRRMGTTGGSGSKRIMSTTNPTAAILSARFGRHGDSSSSTHNKNVVCARPSSVGSTFTTVGGSTSLMVNRSSGNSSSGLSNGSAVRRLVHFDGDGDLEAEGESGIIYRGGSRATDANDLSGCYWETNHVTERDASLSSGSNNVRGRRSQMMESGGAMEDTGKQRQQLLVQRQSDMSQRRQIHQLMSNGNSNTGIWSSETLKMTNNGQPPPLSPPPLPLPEGGEGNGGGWETPGSSRLSGEYVEGFSRYTNATGSTTSRSSAWYDGHEQM